MGHLRVEDLDAKSSPVSKHRNAYEFKRRENWRLEQHTHTPFRLSRPTAPIRTLHGKQVLFSVKKKTHGAYYVVSKLVKGRSLLGRERWEEDSPKMLVLFIGVGKGLVDDVGPVFVKAWSGCCKQLEARYGAFMPSKDKRMAIRLAHTREKRYEIVSTSKWKHTTKSLGSEMYDIKNSYWISVRRAFWCFRLFFCAPWKALYRTDRSFARGGENTRRHEEIMQNRRNTHKRDLPGRKQAKESVARSSFLGLLAGRSFWRAGVSGVLRFVPTPTMQDFQTGPHAPKHARNAKKHQPLYA